MPGYGLTPLLSEDFDNQVDALAQDLEGGTLLGWSMGGLYAIALAQRYPDAVISGSPIYQDAAGRGRRLARWLTHVWIWIETLSFRIRDAMCGFRVYPTFDVLAVAREEPLGRWMDFDPEIAGQVAALRGWSLEETARVTTANACRMLPASLSSPAINAAP